MDVILEVDKRGGFLTEGHDQIVRFNVQFAQAEQFDWEGAINGTLAQIGQRRGLFG
jgi:sporulation-control protein